MSHNVIGVAVPDPDASDAAGVGATTTTVTLTFGSMRGSAAGPQSFGCFQFDGKTGALTAVLSGGSSSNNNNHVITDHTKTVFGVSASRVVKVRKQQSRSSTHMLVVVFGVRREVLRKCVRSGRYFVKVQTQQQSSQAALSSSSSSSSSSSTNTDMRIFFVGTKMRSKDIGAAAAVVNNVETSTARAGRVVNVISARMQQLCPQYFVQFGVAADVYLRRLVVAYSEGAALDVIDTETTMDAVMSLLTPDTASGGVTSKVTNITAPPPLESNGQILAIPQHVQVQDQDQVREKGNKRTIASVQQGQEETAAAAAAAAASSSETGKSKCRRLTVDTTTSHQTTHDKNKNKNKNKSNVAGVGGSQTTALLSVLAAKPTFVFGVDVSLSSVEELRAIRAVVDRELSWRKLRLSKN